MLAEVKADGGNIRLVHLPDRDTFAAITRGGHLEGSITAILAMLAILPSFGLTEQDFSPTNC
jgi:ATP-dependent RNA circularization protein (DNA/RNA ligase family)